jgi:hypothetical protein
MAAAPGHDFPAHDADAAFTDFMLHLNSVESSRANAAELANLQIAIVCNRKSLATCGE